MKDNCLPLIPGYEIGKRLGDKTFRATARRFDRALVVKVHPLIQMRTTNVDLVNEVERLTAFLHRLRRLASLKPPEAHPRIAPLLDYGTTPLLGDQHWQVGVFAAMPFYSQGHFGEAQWSGEHLFDALGLICDGLADLQRAGLAHGRLIPEHIFLDSDRRPLLAYARLTEPLITGGELTDRAGHQLRQAAFLSPEHIRDGHEGLPADLYSLGCILFETLVGQPPFDGPDPMAIAGQHLESPPPPLPAEHAAWQPIINRCLAKPIKGRYASPGELKQAIWDLAGRGRLPSRDPTRDPEASTRRGPSTRGAHIERTGVGILASLRQWLTNARRRP